MSAWLQAFLIGLVRAYRFLLSPWLGSACRFEPTCSLYAIEALRRHGAAGGLVLTLGRVGRCHPWCAGGHDPVPGSPPRFLSQLLRRAPRASEPPPASSESTP